MLAVCLRFGLTSVKCPMLLHFLHSLSKDLHFSWLWPCLVHLGQGYSAGLGIRCGEGTGAAAGPIAPALETPPPITGAAPPPPWAQLPIPAACGNRGVISLSFTPHLSLSCIVIFFLFCIFSLMSLFFSLSLLILWTFSLVYIINFFLSQLSLSFSFLLLFHLHNFSLSFHFFMLIFLGHCFLSMS